MGVSRRLYELAKAVLEGRNAEMPIGIANLIIKEFEWQGEDGTRKKTTDTAPTTTSTDPPGGSVLPSNPNPAGSGGGRPHG